MTCPDACTCCTPGQAAATLENRPGQPTLAYRTATYRDFFRRMVESLSTQAIPDGALQNTRPLSALTTRTLDDPALAILDSWAVVTDVLTFYEERIANEGYLRTLTDRRSVLELARSIGYEMSPGVAASAYLAFTVEDAVGGPTEAKIATGTRIQSLPEPGKLPQTFETIEAIDARPEWNVLHPRTTEPHLIQMGTPDLYLKGVTTRLQPGDIVLLVGKERGDDFKGDERWDVRVILTVEVHPEENYTYLTFERGLGDDEEHTGPSPNPRVYALRQRASLFGFNAPDYRVMPADIKTTFTAEQGKPNEWPNFRITTGKKIRIHLDSIYPKILKGSWIALVRPGYSEAYKVIKAAASSRTDFTLTSKTSRLELDTDENLYTFGLRDTVVYGQSEFLERSEKPWSLPMSGMVIPLDRRVEGLEKGRTLILSGKRIRASVLKPSVLTSSDGRTFPVGAADSLVVLETPRSNPDSTETWSLLHRDGFEGSITVAPGAIKPAPSDAKDPVLSEVAFIEEVESQDRTILTLQRTLLRSYDRKSVTLYANVARATHGETVREVLGSGGDASQRQRFALKKSPLTFVSAPTPSGGESTLDVKVNGVSWKEASSLYEAGERDESYMIRENADGRFEVIFGDGRRGVRPPAGVENITAIYRSGIGPDGQVGAGTLTLLQTRPQGVKGVTNPLAATGADAPETMERARINAPLTVMTLDRIVSPRDFEDFTRAFSGIGKARADILWNGESQVAHITVAAADGSPVDPKSELYVNLAKAIETARDPVHQVQIAGFDSLSFNVSAKLRIDDRYSTDAVKAEVQAVLATAFSFEARAFAQPVTAAEVISEIQRVKGVIAVDLDELHLTKGGTGLEQAIPALPARWWNGAIAPAQLLLLHPTGVVLGAMTNP